jgi:polar amino acid transport system substrate-binding protein
MRRCSSTTSQEAIRAFIAGEGDMVAGIRQPLASVAREIRSFACCLSFSQIQQAICVPATGYSTMNFCGCLAAWMSDGTIADMINRHIGNR